MEAWRGRSAGGGGGGEVDEEEEEKEATSGAPRPFSLSIVARLPA